MKKSLVLLGSVLCLAACSGGGGGTPGGVGPLGAPINPSQAPQNPASKQAIKKLFAEMNAMRAVVPSGEAIFPEVLWGEYVSKVDEESRLKAEAELNEIGRDFLVQIRTKCSLSPVTIARSGDVEKSKTGEIVLVKMSQTSSDGGLGCEYLSSKQYDSSTRIVERSSSLSEVGENVDHTIKEENESSSKQILNSRAVAAGVYRSVKSSSTSREEIESRFQRLGAGKYKYFSKRTTSSSGNSEAVLANGTRIVSASQDSYSSESGVYRL